MTTKCFQPDLFNKIPDYIFEIKKPPRYIDLNINQKINVKYNSGNFAINYLRMSLPYNYRHLRHDDIFTHIDWDHHIWEKDHNHGGKRSIRSTKSIKEQVFNFN